MMKQMSLGNNVRALAKRTRKREFLDEMNRVVPWGDLTKLIEPHYPKGKLRLRHLLETHSIGRSDAGCDQRAVARPWPDVAGRHGGRGDADCGTEFDQERRWRAQTPRCIRPRRATSGASA